MLLKERSRNLRVSERAAIPSGTSDILQQAMESLERDFIESTGAGRVEKRFSERKRSIMGSWEKVAGRSSRLLPER